MTSREADVEVGAGDFVPARRTIPALRTAAAGCRGCHLWRAATQTVFGEGARAPRLLLVGEQPGDREDLSGHPFVGPAGGLLDEALLEAGIDRSEAYVTNAVKHFKWSPDDRGTERRIHNKPNAAEVRACYPWLEAEIATLRPRVLLALGATATRALFGPTIKLTAQRGRILPTLLAEVGFVTIHPSAVLRTIGSAERARAKRAFVADLRKVATYLAR